MQPTRYHQNWLFRKWDYIILIGCCATIRLYHIDTIDLWIDEIYSFFSLHQLSNFSHLSLSVRNSFCYTFVDIFFKSFFDEGTLYSHNYLPRIPAFIFGIFSVLILYDGFRRFRGRTAGFIIACLSCTSYPLVIYSTRSRVYSMTQFFLALCVWYFLSLENKIERGKIVRLFVVSILGFLTYPYMAHAIGILYVILGVMIVKQKEKQYYRFFFAWAATYFIAVAILMFVMKSTYSHESYTTIPFTFSFFLYSMQHMIGYLASKNIVFFFFSLLLPILYMALALTRRLKMDSMIIYWSLGILMMIFHAVVITHTKNIFNPRHISFMAIPFLAAQTIGFCDFQKLLTSVFVTPRSQKLIAILLSITIPVLALSSIDFVFYCKHGINYLDGPNEYTFKINTINQTLKKSGTSEIYLVYYRPSRDLIDNYQLYHYRTNKAVIRYRDLKSLAENKSNTMDRKRLGFVILQNIAPQSFSKHLLTTFDIYESLGVTIFISKIAIPRTKWINFVDTHTPAMEALNKS
ncbi:MAG: hypothetical protein GY847_14655 [Proteobacteria bacterium]|nr:hypothetical protein [Pseudomonadota bacterium]